METELPAQRSTSWRIVRSAQIGLGIAAVAVFVRLYGLGMYTPYISWPTVYVFPTTVGHNTWMAIAGLGMAMFLTGSVGAFLLSGIERHWTRQGLHSIEGATKVLQLLWFLPLMAWLCTKSEAFTPNFGCLFVYLGVVAAALMIFGYRWPWHVKENDNQEDAEPDDDPEDGPPPVSLNVKILLGVGVSASTLLFSVQTILQYHAGNFGYADSGFVAEALWNTLHGRFMYAHNFIPPMLLADHFSPMWLALLPFYAVFPRHETLIVASAVSLAVTAVPLFLLARWEWRRNVPALCIALGYLMFPAAQHEVSSFSFGFQGEVMAVPLIAWACYCMRRQWWKRFWLFLVLVLCCKETLSALVLGLGLSVFFLQKNRKQGIAVSAFAVVWMLGTTKLLLPWLKDVWPSDEVILDAEGTEQYYQFEQFFGHLGKSYGEAAFNLLRLVFTSPIETVSKILHREVWVFFAQMLLPVCLLSLLSPGAMLLGAAHFFMMLVSFEKRHFFCIYQHYKIALIFVPFYSAVFGTKFFAEGTSWLHRLIDRFGPERVRSMLPGTGRAFIRAAAVGILGSSLLHCYYFGPTPLSKTYVPKLYDTTTPRAQALARMKALIPLDASIVTTHRAAAHFTDRKQLYCIPLNHRKDPELMFSVDFILLDLKDFWGDTDYKHRKKLLQTLESKNSYGLINIDQSFRLFKRIEP